MAESTIPNLTPFQGVADLTLSTKFASSNAKRIAKYGRVATIFIDATVGNTAIPDWELVATLPSGYAVNNSSSGVVSISNATDKTVALANMAVGNGVNFVIGHTLSANKRYIIGVTFAY